MTKRKHPADPRCCYGLRWEDGTFYTGKAGPEYRAKGRDNAFRYTLEGAERVRANSAWAANCSIVRVY